MADKEETIDLLEVRGTTGLKIQGGYVDEEWHRKLKGSLGAKMYREMADNSPIVGAFTLGVDSLVGQVPWAAEPSGKEDRHKQESDWLNTAMTDMSHSFSDHVSEVLTEIVYGWAPFEIVYKKRMGEGKDPRYRSDYNDSRYGWRKLQIMAQESLSRWRVDEDGGIKGMWQTTDQGGDVYVPIEKMLLYRTKVHKNNPEGRSLLRNAYTTYHALKNAEFCEGVGIERDLAGYPVLQVPIKLMLAKANADDKALRADLEKMIQEIKRDEREGLLIPSETDSNGKPTGYKFSLMNAGGRRPIDVDVIVKRRETRIAMSVFWEFIMLGMDKVGSFALASSKTHMSAVALGVILDRIKQVLNRFAVPRLMRINGVPREYWPLINHGDIEKPDLAAVGAFLTAMSAAGFPINDEPTEKWARELGGLPPPQAPDLGVAA